MNGKFALAAMISAIALGALPTAQAGTSDLEADWSNANNPNGPWSLHQGNGVLPFEDSWPLIPGIAGWCTSGTGGPSLPIWFQSQIDGAVGFDWAADDVVVHTTDRANGAGNGSANVVWTSDVSGTAMISGGVWMGRDIGRGNDWFIYLNDTLLTSGHIESGDPFSSANPFDFANGSAGAKAVHSVAISPCDTIKLELVRTTPAGDFVVVNISIDEEGTLPPDCPADFGGNCDVGGDDLGHLLLEWGSKGSDADLTGDGTVNGADLGELLLAWGPCGT